MRKNKSRYSTLNFIKYVELAKKSLFSLLIILGVMVSPAQSSIFDLFNSKSNTEKVKSSVLKAYPQTTIGNAMDNWKACDNSFWEEFETENYTKTVQFNCEITDFRDMRADFDKSNREFDKSRGARKSSRTRNYQRLNYILLIVQWVINADGTISTSYAKIEALKWDDGVGYKFSQQDKESDSEDINNMLTLIYNNAGDNVMEFFGSGYALSELYDRIEYMEKFIADTPETTQNITSVNSENRQYSQLQTLQNLIRKNDKQGIANLIQYPLNRAKPLPAIQNSKEFINKFDYIFDDILKKIVLNATEVDITSMGYRGDMLKDGTLWFNDGKIIAINYQSNKERKFAQNVNTFDKNSIHESLKNFNKNVLIIETESYKIRIDELKNLKYRYASWDKDKRESDKPNLILGDGKMESHGTGGDHSYIFEIGIYKYEVYISILGGEDPNYKGSLIIYKDNKQFAEQDIVELK